ncbi:CBO0543 family protein [Ammoniphilus sp. YIM 78166]|uniref:CBO0543 family protein n=1 Tax=Ammoniphilus sp. YIM 78166 TaxID=1644106 RepID=UPI00106F47C4|nr:CBO0543 family protein [Ammoniphilus sp. YIM 78166]
MNEELRERIDKAYAEIARVNIEFFPIWKEQFFLKPFWWVSFGLTIIPWAFWIYFRKKESTSRLLFAGFYVMLISSYFDFLGISYGLWDYHAKIAPHFPTFIPWDLSLMPVTIMTFIQLKPTVSPIWKGLLFSGITAFVIEPILVWVDYYYIIKWEYMYSFPIYFLIYLSANWLSKRKSFDNIV